MLAGMPGRSCTAFVRSVDGYTPVHTAPQSESMGGQEQIFSRGRHVLYPEFAGFPSGALPRSPQVTMASGASATSLRRGALRPANRRLAAVDYHECPGLLVDCGRSRHGRAQKQVDCVAADAAVGLILADACPCHYVFDCRIDGFVCCRRTGPLFAVGLPHALILVISNAKTVA